MYNKILFFFFFTISIISYSQKKIGLYWDVSLSMQERNIEREFNFLNNYFKKNTEVDLKLIMFSNEIILEQNYKIEQGDWNALRIELSSAIYDGGTSYKILFDTTLDEYIVSTDAIESMGKFKPSTDKPIHFMSTIENSNTIELKLASKLSNGTFSHLVFNNTNLKKENQPIINEEDGHVTGTVSDANGVLINVNIFNKNTNKGTSTNNKGFFKIKADEGDVLVYTYLGKKTSYIRIGKVKELYVVLDNDGENLDEVVLKARVDEKEEVINLGESSIDKKRLGYDVEMITSDDVSNQDTDLIGAVKGQFTNLTIPNKTNGRIDLSQFLGRGKNMTILGNQYGLIVVDGVPLNGSDSGANSITGAGLNSAANNYVSQTDNMIDPSMVHSITYLKGLAATNRYGTIGRNGVLLITTKNAIAGKDYTKKQEALGTTATYSGNAVELETLPNNNYINDLKTAKTVGEAFEKYLIQRAEFGNQPSFYFDVYDYFKGWNNDVISKRILSNVYEIALDNSKALKILAYKQQEQNELEAALYSFELIKKLEPQKSQSYRDLALAHFYNKDYKTALRIYNNLDKNRAVNNVNTRGIKKTILNDAKQLITKAGSLLQTNHVNPMFLKPITYKARIIFEWNDLDSEFDLSIINPQKRYFTWSHTNTKNAQRIAEEKEQGYGLEEYYLTNSDKGQWTFNMKYYGKTSKDKEPTYIKITIYKDFETSKEQQIIKVVRLDKKNIEQTVAKVLID